MTIHERAARGEQEPTFSTMRRETTNRLRFILEDLLPPLFKDSFLFRWIAQLAWGRHILTLEAFRRRAPFLSAAEYERLYREHPRVHQASDNSERCVQKIITDVVGTSVCDVGCGTGYLLRRIDQASRQEQRRLVGVDFVATRHSENGIEFLPAKIESLPFKDAEFDTVICTHVLEHILDIRLALSELRRITRRRLIIVVPRERETRYTFNPHFHFFAYPATFLRMVIPIPESHQCLDLGRDIYYCEDIRRTTQ